VVAHGRLEESLMETAKGAGRVVGVMLLVQMTAAFVVNQFLLGPIFAPPGYMMNAASDPLSIRLAVLIGLGSGALTAAIAIAAVPVFRRYSRTMTLWFLVLATVSFALTVVENMNIMSLLSLSQLHAKANGADAALFEALRVVVGSARNWAHYIGLMISGGMLLVMYGVLCRFALVPRVLAAFGLGAVLLQLTAVTMPLFGRPIVFLLLMPLAASHLILSLWLMARGFSDRAAPVAEGVKA
jgi:hypothetical protein